MNFKNIPIEVWLIDLMDGTLSEEVKKELLSYCLVNNIEINQDFTTLLPSEEVHPSKDLLKFPTHDSILKDPKQDLLLAYSEGLLDPAGTTWVEQRILDNRSWQIMHYEISATYLEPEAYDFPEKKALYKSQPNRRWLYTTIAAAAVFIGLILYLFPNNPIEPVANKSANKAKVKTKSTFHAQPVQPDISSTKKTLQVTHKVSGPHPVEGIIIASSRDCILHPEAYSKDEIATTRPNSRTSFDSLQKPTDELTQLEVPKNNEKTLRSWIKERLIERIFKQEDSALLLERETKWFNQTVGIKYKRQEDRSISLVKLGPFILEWNKKNKNSNFLSMMPSNK